jgi:hypothetical protein
MTRQELDPKLDPTMIDPTRGLERDGDEWTLFGLSLEPDAWLASDEATRRAVDRLWVGPANWSREDPGILHGRIVGARAEVRALAERGVRVRGVAWADLGGSTGHHSVALALEGASRVLLVDERDPGCTARRVLEALSIEVVVGDAYEVPLVGIDAALALYSVDPVALVGPGVDVVVLAPPRERFEFDEPDDCSSFEEGQRCEEGDDTSGLEGSRLDWTSALQMGDGCCRLGAPHRVTVEVWKRPANRDDEEDVEITEELYPGHAEDHARYLRMKAENPDFDTILDSMVIGSWNKPPSM